MSEPSSKPWVVYGLIAANVVVFAIEIASGADPIKPAATDIIALGGNFPPLTLGGEWWRLVASTFLHFGILHLALNMVCLYQVRAVETAFGHVGFAVIYALAGLGGGIASLIASPGNAVAAGASGCVFGAFGAYTAALVVHRAQYDPAWWARRMRSLATFFVINAAVGLSNASISMSSHVGGLVVGGALGAALLLGANADAVRTRRALALAALGIALTAVAVMTIKPDPLYPAIDRFYAVERAGVARQNAAIERLDAHQMTDTEYADLVEREVYVPYRKVRDELRALPDVPPRLRALLVAIDALLDARITAWDTFRAAVAEHDPARHRELMETYRRQRAELPALVQAATDETERLRR